MSEMRATCHGCVHSRYHGSTTVTGKLKLMGGTAVPIREHDSFAPGRYDCEKLGVKVCGGDETPKELEPGCKEKR